jgi:hypothetical protein
LSQPRKNLIEANLKTFASKIKPDLSTVYGK